MVASDLYAESVARPNFTMSERLLHIVQQLVTPEEGKLLLELPAEPPVPAQKLGIEEEAV